MSLLNYGVGLQIVESPLMVDYVEDWSRVRSPSRARRRLKAGHPQRIRQRAVPKSEAFRMGNQLVMHPLTAIRLRAELAKRAKATVNQETERAFFGMA